MKKHQKLGLKPFLAQENHYLDRFSLYIYTLNLYCKWPISAIPGHTPTQISQSMNLILAFRIKRWLRIEKLFHMNSVCIFDP